jgi:hypothetical protein
VTRDEHLAFAKLRALKYLDAGDLAQALNSMESDLAKHPELKYPGFLGEVGLLYVLNRDARALRRWIEGFN